MRAWRPARRWSGPKPYILTPPLALRLTLTLALALALTLALTLTPTQVERRRAEAEEAAAGDQHALVARLQAEVTAERARGRSADELDAAVVAKDALIDRLQVGKRQNAPPRFLRRDLTTGKSRNKGGGIFHQADKSSVSDGGEDQGAEEAFMGREEVEESSRQFWKEPSLARAGSPLSARLHT